MTVIDEIKQKYQLNIKFDYLIQSLNCSAQNSATCWLPGLKYKHKNRRKKTFNFKKIRLLIKERFLKMALNGSPSFKSGEKKYLKDLLLF